MTPFVKLIKKPKVLFTDRECDILAERMSQNETNATMESVPVGTVFWLQFDPTHNALNSVEDNGVFFNKYSPACDLEGSYAEHGGWMYDGDKFALHETGGLPRFDLGRDNSREIMADFRGNENSFLRRMHLLTCQIHNKCIDLGKSFSEAKAITIAITNRITQEQSLLVTGDDFNNAKVDKLVGKKFHNSLEWNFAAARYAHAMCPSLVQGEDPLKTGRVALEIDLVSLFDGSEKAKTLDPSVSIAMRNMASVPIKKNIIKRTLSRTVEIGLASYGEMASFVGMKRELTAEEQRMPIWAGMLFESQRTMSGQRLGPVGSVLVHSGNDGHLRENYEGRQGLWYDLDGRYPETMNDTIEWVNS